MQARRAATLAVNQAEDLQTIKKQVMDILWSSKVTRAIFLETKLLIDGPYQGRRARVFIYQWTYKLQLQKEDKILKVNSPIFKKSQRRTTWIQVQWLRGTFYLFSTYLADERCYMSSSYFTFAIDIFPISFSKEENFFHLKTNNRTNVSGLMRYSCTFLVQPSENQGQTLAPNWMHSPPSFDTALSHAVSMQCAFIILGVRNLWCFLRYCKVLLVISLSVFNAASCMLSQV